MPTYNSLKTGKIALWNASKFCAQMLSVLKFAQEEWDLNF